MALRQADGPPLRHLVTEPGRAAADFGKYLAARPLVMPRLPEGDGHPVLVLPGLLADDVSTGLLRGRLCRLGYRAHGWKLGRNIGPTARCVQGLEDRMTELADRYGRQVSVIGWSLGGIYARDIGRRSPEAVRQVITLGSPFRIARNSQSWASRTFDRYSHLHVQHRTLPLETESLPLLVPATSIYSHSDGIVHWETCLNAPGDRCENIAVRASHLGLGHHPAAIWAVADRLAQPEGTWKPFRAPAALRPLFPKPAAASPGDSVPTPRPSASAAQPGSAAATPLALA